MPADILTELYKISEQFENATPEEISKDSSKFQYLLEQAKGTNQAKSFVSQLIPTYAVHFPSLQEKVFNVQLELCQDEEISVRVHAIRGLSQLAKTFTDQVARIVDALAQLIITTEDSVEEQTLRRTFVLVLDINATEAFSALFTLFASSDEATRTKLLRFINQEIRDNSKLINKAEGLKAHIAGEVKNVFTTVDLTNVHFERLLRIYNRFSPRTEESKTELLEILYKFGGIITDEDYSSFTVSEDTVKNFTTAVMKAYSTVYKFKKDLETSFLLRQFLKAIVPELSKLTPMTILNVTRAISLITNNIHPRNAKLLYPEFYEFFLSNLPNSAEFEPIAQDALISSILSNTDIEEQNEYDEEQAAEDKEGTENADEQVTEEAEVAETENISTTTTSTKEQEPIVPFNYEGNVNFTFVEALLFMFHRLSAPILDLVQDLTGLKVPSGQPSMVSSAEIASRREALVTALEYIKSACEEFRPVLKNAKSQFRKEKNYRKLRGINSLNHSVDASIKLTTELLKNLPVFVSHENAQLSYGPRFSNTKSMKQKRPGNQSAPNTAKKHHPQNRQHGGFRRRRYNR